MDAITAIAIASLAIATTSGGLDAIMSASASQGTFSLLNAVQLLLLLPLIGVYLPANIISYITSMNFSLFNFDFLSWQKAPKIESETSKIDYDQREDYLAEIGLTSGNSAINMVGLLGISSLIPVIHLLFGISYL